MSSSCQGSQKSSDQVYDNCMWQQAILPVGPPPKAGFVAAPAFCKLPVTWKCWGPRVITSTLYRHHCISSLMLVHTTCQGHMQISGDALVSCDACAQSPGSHVMLALWPQLTHVMT